MEYFAAIDVALERSSVCVVDGTGKIISEATACTTGYGVNWVTTV